MSVPRPSPAATPSSRAGGLLVGLVVWAVLVAIPAGTVGGGSWLLYQRYAGTAVQATVLECDTSGLAGRRSTVRQDCVAEWELDGRTVTGPFLGGNGDSDVGKTVDATVRGDSAYSRSLVLPLVLIGLGLPFLVLLVTSVRRRLAARGASEQA